MSRLSTALKQSALQPKAMTDAEEFKRAQDGYVTEEEEDEEVQEEEAMVEGTLFLFSFMLIGRMIEADDGGN
jgi:hypothetical protein